MKETTYNILKSDCERLKNEKVDGAITPNRLGDILCRMVESDKSDGDFQEITNLLQLLD